MKIYHNSRFISALKRFIPHQNGDWLNHLIGIDLHEDHQGDINVYPVYRSLRIRQLAVGVFIEVPIFSRQFLVLIDAKGIHSKFIEASQLQLSDVGIKIRYFFTYDKILINPYNTSNSFQYPMAQLGKYDIMEEIGRGGFGIVYKARDRSLDRLVALKILHPKLTVDAKFLDNFRQEAQSLAKINHPNVVSIYEIDEIEGKIYIAMEYLPGGCLTDKLN